MNGTFATRLRKAMNKRGIKQAELVKRTGISKSAISQYLSGAFVPKQKYTYKLASALNVDPTWLIGKDVEMERQQKIKPNTIAAHLDGVGLSKKECEELDNFIKFLLSKRN
jgi:transcriptional regulator with XRE-family HTH domain